MIDSEKSLSYRYQLPHWPPGAAVAEAAPANPTPAAVHLAQAVPLSAPLVAFDTGAQAKALPAQATTLQIAIPQEAKQRITELVTGANPATLVLRIDVVEIPADRSAVVQVFTRNFRLLWSRNWPATLSGKDNLSVTLVPVTGANKPPEVLGYR
jgi:hypothetical protein